MLRLLTTPVSAEVMLMMRPQSRSIMPGKQRYGPYREEALFYMGAAWPALRRLALELGRRLLAAGTLASPDTVFYLDSEDLVQACTARGAHRTCPDLISKAQHRCELREALELRARRRSPAYQPTQCSRARGE